jgi:hypothetical protein
MRLRLRVLACALTVLGSIAAPGLASAAPRHNHHLTIAAVPNPIVAGEAVVIYGRLFGPNNVDRPIRLYHHLDGSGQGFSLIGTTMTDSSGYYEFTREENVVESNRDWFVRGPDGAHSRTVHERVQALISLAASTDSSDTAHPIVFTGHVDPNHAFERVFLQEQNGSSDDWRTLAGDQLGPGSNYLIAYRWRIPAAHDLRVLFRGDARNIRSVSDPVTVIIEQAQVPGFTINTSDPIVGPGGSATISGTNTTQPNTPVQLWSRPADQPHFVVLADGSTNANGNYSFTPTGLNSNTLYYVATMRLPHTPRRHTAVLFEGVKDTVTMQASTGNTTTGQTVTFTGTVLPDKAGHVVYLQKQGKDGDFHTVEIAVVGGDSTFQFSWTIGSPGTHVFRARITSDENNIGSVSAPVTVNATAPPASSLPPAS